MCPSAEAGAARTASISAARTASSNLFTSLLLPLFVMGRSPLEYLQILTGSYFVQRAVSEKRSSRQFGVIRQGACWGARFLPIIQTVEQRLSGLQDIPSTPPRREGSSTL